MFPNEFFFRFHLCLHFYSFCAILLHLLMKWFIVSSTLLHILHLLYALSILALIMFVLMACSWASSTRVCLPPSGTIFHLFLPFLSNNILGLSNKLAMQAFLLPPFLALFRSLCSFTVSHTSLCHVLIELLHLLQFPSDNCSNFLNSQNDGNYFCFDFP